MKKALIDPQVFVSQITAWIPNPDSKAFDKYIPVYTPIANSARVAEVAISDFPVSPPLFWITCNDEVVADQWYYDTANELCVLVPEGPPYPDAASDSLPPAITGAQTL